MSHVLMISSDIRPSHNILGAVVSREKSRTDLSSSVRVPASHSSSWRELALMDEYDTRPVTCGHVARYVSVGPPLN